MKENKTDMSTEKEPTELQKLQEQVEALTAENEKILQESEELQAENEKLKKQVARMQDSSEKSEKYLAQLVAMKNDFDSYKRRMKLNTENAKAEGVQSVVNGLLPLADNFELAEKSISDVETLKAFQMVHAELKKLFGELGVSQMEVLGQPFDHNTMNALSKLDRGEENTDKVVEVYKNGYTMGEKVIRYAEVIVGA